MLCVQVIFSREYCLFLPRLYGFNSVFVECLLCDSNTLAFAEKRKCPNPINNKILVKIVKLGDLKPLQQLLLTPLAQSVNHPMVEVGAGPSPCQGGPTKFSLGLVGLNVITPYLNNPIT